MAGARDIGTMFGAGEAETFLGLPTCADPGRFSGSAVVVGAPCATPYPSVGAYCAGAPAAIRRAMAGYAANLHHVDFDLGEPLYPEGTPSAADLGDLALDPGNAAENRIAIRQTVRGILAAGAVPILIGGDDSVPIPLIEAFHDRGPVTVVQIDAHIDWREEVGGERWGLSSTMRRASEMPHVFRLVQIGQRAIGSARPGDLADARAWGVHFVSARDLERQGLEPALEAVPAGSDVVVAFDCDALDPAIMPGVIGRAPGGLSYWQAVELLTGIARRAPIRAFDLVEFMPERDVDNIGALTAARLLCHMLAIAHRQWVRAA
jgi:agmatinase